MLIIDRYDGGGSTRRSGGVVYFGGGTDLQSASNITDSVSQMFRYISKENGGVETGDDT